MERANILIYPDSTLFVLLKKERTTSNYWLIFHGSSFSDSMLTRNSGWGYMWKYGTNDGLYCDFSACDITIDFEEIDEHFRIVLSQGKNKKAIPDYEKLDEIAIAFGLTPFGRFQKAYSIEVESVEDGKNKIKEIAQSVSETFKGINLLN